MCLILVKHKNTKLNSTFFEYCEKAAISNSDGMGYALKRAHRDSIIVNKGFKKAMDLITHLETLKIKEDDELIIHFRAATHGSRSKANCHPFIVNNKETGYDELEKEFLHSSEEPVDVTLSLTKNIHPIAFMHNGIMYEWEKMFENDSDFSDTRNFAKRFLQQNYKGESVASNFYIIKRDEHPTDFNDKFKQAFPKLKGQKFAFMSAKYGILLLGDFIKDNFGFYHSNSGAMYKQRVY